jgi:hypothetical protein
LSVGEGRRLLVCRPPRCVQLGLESRAVGDEPLLPEQNHRERERSSDDDAQREKKEDV